jgi:hypothetical protein
VDSTDPIVAAHKHCFCNEQEVSQSELCGCFYCVSIFPTSEIVEWLKEVNKPDSGRTAFCPHCTIDSVIGSKSGYPITKEFLEAMRLRWFGD